MLTHGQHEATNLQNVMQLPQHLPLMVTELKLPQPQVPMLCNSINCLPVVNTNINHITTQIPAGGNIAWYQVGLQLKITADLPPSRENNGCQMNNLEGQFAQLFQAMNNLSQVSVSTHLANR